VHLKALAEASFGIGVICWLLLGSAILNRLFTRPALPAALVPAMAIETAPPAVAGLAWFALDGRTVNVVACVLGGYAVLMALAQLRLIRSTPGSPSPRGSGPSPSPIPPPSPTP
jgi:tellurite resistance protein